MHDVPREKRGLERTALNVLQCNSPFHLCVVHECVFVSLYVCVGDSAVMTVDHKQGEVCIFGTGDFGRSLGLRLLQAGYEVVFGSRDPKNSPLVPKGSKVMIHTEAARTAQVIFIAVQRDHYEFLTSLTPALEGKVLVDISNNLKRGQFPQSNAEYLSSLVPGASVVKGFNTVSAWALQSGALDASRQVRGRDLSPHPLSLTGT